MLKAKIGRQSSNSCENVAEAALEQQQSGGDEEAAAVAMPQRKADLCAGIDGNLEKLDSLIDKAETAHYTMLEQRKQMDKFLK